MDRTTKRKRPAEQRAGGQKPELPPDVFACDCELEGLLGQYLEEARAQGVDLDSGEGDSTDISCFQSPHLEGLCTGDADICSEGNPSLAPGGGGGGGGGGDGQAPPSAKRVKKEKKFLLPHGSGDLWTEYNPPGSGVRQSTQRQAVAFLASAGSSPLQGPSKRRGRRGKGSQESRARGGADLKEAGGDEKVRDSARLRKKWIGWSKLYYTRGYSILENGSRVSTGWHGKNPSAKARQEIRRLYRNGSIKDIVSKFFPVYADDPLRPAILLDSKWQIFFFRSIVADWLAQSAEEFKEASTGLLASSLASKALQSSCAKGVRGPHFPCIIGYHRQYSKEPKLTKWHRDHQTEVDAFISNPLIQRITAWVSSIVRLIFPGVAERFDKSAQWHLEKYGISPPFGQFWNFCINGMFKGQTRIHCDPHADSKNIVGVCVLVIYQLPGTKFNHSKRSWLVLWEAGVAIQLPPWTMVCYPSALLYHFNIDIHDFKFVTTEGDERPTPENSTPIEDGDEEGRGSLVYFNQASMYCSSETDGGSKPGPTDYEACIQQAFSNPTCYSLSPPL